MYARVARWEGADAAQMREAVEAIKASGGPPEGVPAKGILVLSDPDGGRAMFVGLFETEEDRRKGDETLNAMNPPAGSMGRRVAVEMYEVSLDARAAGAEPVVG